MSTLHDVLDAAVTQLHTDAGEATVDTALLEAVAKGLGPAIYNDDASTVSCSDKDELARVRESFVKEKLGVGAPDEEIDAAIASVCEKLGTSNRNKLRVVFYYLLTRYFGKEDIYKA